ncbi:ArsR family transcriptional regulator [Amycolatopsis sp. WAC 01375]|uniref:ArsR/SmtB family transcription factor n=1 Tax=Amycolatopsis sp. WAC 01375 TaxID=2203194 RepID=UPI000F799042|nr:winged helix-turn-helix domain-containing protein [Amycolatopsis sp. WAC 01375]RSM72964.1 ArsR family transcriptional regulator [Amycolatopsis sp. WAC 01375]
MLKVRFTAQDLLNVIVADTPAPLMELALALMTLQRDDNCHVFGGWRRRTIRNLPTRAEPLLQLLSPTGIGPLFLDPPSAGLDDGLSQVLATDRAVVEAELRRICATDRPQTAWIRQLAAQDRHAWHILKHAIVEAHRHVLAAEWPRLQVAFHAESAWRTHFLARNGLERTLTSLSAGLRWRDMSLEIDSPDVDREVTLCGEGVVLLPSLLWAGRVLAARQPAGPALIIYPALTPLPLHDAETVGDPLAALLGSTRADTLRVLTKPHTTTELAHALHVSVSAASVQARTLRDARLITTHRDGKAVLHWCTPLGVSLIAAPTTGPVNNRSVVAG